MELTVVRGPARVAPELSTFEENQDETLTIRVHAKPFTSPSFFGHSCAAAATVRYQLPQLSNFMEAK
jgi:hypothetical protein